MSMIDSYGRARMSLVRSPFQPVAETHRTVESAQAEKLWAALFTARGRDSSGQLADLEDAVFRFYLPMARTLARESVQSAPGSAAAEEAAELGLAQAVLAWRHRDHSGFRRFATSAITVQLNSI